MKKGFSNKLKVGDNFTLLDTGVLGSLSVASESSKRRFGSAGLSEVSFAILALAFANLKANFHQIKKIYEPFNASLLQFLRLPRVHDVVLLLIIKLMNSCREDGSSATSKNWHTNCKT